MKILILLISLLLSTAFSYAADNNKLTEATLFLQDYFTQREMPGPDEFLREDSYFEFIMNVKDTNILKVIDLYNKQLKETEPYKWNYGVKIAVLLKYSNGKIDTLCISNWFNSRIYKNGKYYELESKLFEIIQLISPKVLQPEIDCNKYLGAGNLEIYFNMPKR